MGSISLGEIEVTFEVDVKDDLVIVSMNSGAITAQAAISQEEYTLLVNEMYRVLVAMESGQ